MADLIGWGIVGTGAVAQSFALGLAHAPGARLAAVSSRDAARGQAFASAYGAAKVHMGLEALLGDKDVDVVYIATPNHRHVHDCLAAIEVGKAVLCEKPFALNAAEARQTAEAARHKGVFCMEAMWMRFMPLVQRAKRMIESGEVGQVLCLTADFAMPVLEEPAGRYFDAARGGGALLDRGVYCLSLAHYLLGEPRSLTSHAVLTDSGVDATSSYVLTYAGGAQATMWSSIRARGTNEAAVYGTKANLRLHEPFMRPHRLTMQRVPAPGREQPPVPSAPGMKDRLKQNAAAQKVLRRVQQLVRRPDKQWLEPVAGTGYQYEAVAVMDCLRAGQRECSIMPLDESIKIMEMMDTIRDQWKTV